MLITANFHVRRSTWKLFSILTRIVLNKNLTLYRGVFVNLGITWKMESVLCWKIVIWHPVLGEIGLTGDLVSEIVILENAHELECAMEVIQMLRCILPDVPLGLTCNYAHTINQLSPFVMLFILSTQFVFFL